jgi:hypothetical protein
MSTYDDASLIYYPSGYKAGTAYSLKPTDGSGDLTFTRASTATRVNEQGLIEGVRTNLLTYSEQFDNAAWSKINVTATANSTISPTGTLTADKLVENTENNQHRIDQTTTSAIGTNSFSVYGKKDARDSLQLRVGTSGAFFDLTNGTISGISGVTATIESLPNGWYRCSIIRTSVVANEVVRLNLAIGINSTYLGDGTSGIYIWGAQLEASVQATEYIPTTTTAVSVGMLANVPRIDYTSGCGKLLLEPQRTNTLLNSENLNSWLKLDTSVTVNTTTSPNGTTNADTVTATGAGSLSHLIYQNLAFTSGTAYSYSVFAKANTSNYIQLVFAGNLIANSYANFDLSSGTITASAFVTAKIEDYGNGWYRCSISATSAASTTNSQIIYLINSPTASRGQSFVQSGESVYLWGGSFENGSYPTSYIPTTSTAVTRVADVAFNDNFVVANNSNFAVSGEFFLLEDASDIYGRNGAIILRLFLTGKSPFSYFISFQRSANKFNVRYKNDLGNNLSFTNDQNFDFGVWNKYAVSVEVGVGIKIAINGVLQSFANPSIVAMTTDRISTNAYDNSNMGGKIQNLITYPTALEDADLISLTT